MMKTMLVLTAFMLAGAALLHPPDATAQGTLHVPVIEGTLPGSFGNVASLSAEDEEAIKHVLLAETDFFYARDYEGWAGTWAHEPEAIQIWNNDDGSYTHSIGWETISKNVREFLQANPEPDATPMWRENFAIRNYGDVAFVTFDKFLGDRETARPVKEIRVVEKVGDEWRIVCMAAFVNHVEP